MRKLFNLKEWLTVADAARHLSILFGEDVTDADVLRLGLDGHLRLSVHFVNHAKALCGKVVGLQDVEWGEFLAEITAGMPGIPDEAQGKPYPYLKSINIDGERFINLSKNVTTLHGVWDLPMIGNEVLDVEHAYQKLTQGPAVTLVGGLEGAFVEGRSGEMCQLHADFEHNEDEDGSMAQQEILKKGIAEGRIEDSAAESLLCEHEKLRKKFLEKRRTRPDSEKYHPSGVLPKDAVIVVRTEALRDFERALDEADEVPEKPVHPTERKSFLIIIAALCDHSHINLGERGAAAQIAKLSENLNASVSPDTVGRVIEKINDVVELRKK